MIIRCAKCRRQFGSEEWPALCSQCAREKRGVKSLLTQIGAEPPKEQYKVCPHCDGLGKVPLEKAGGHDEPGSDC